MTGGVSPLVRKRLDVAAGIVVGSEADFKVNVVTDMGALSQLWAVLPDRCVAGAVSERPRLRGWARQRGPLRPGA